MILNDPELREIIKNDEAIEITNKQFTVIPNRSGSCDDCYFQSKEKCPPHAVRICCSNGGNILKLKEQNNK